MEFDLEKPMSSFWQLHEQMLKFKNDIQKQKICGKVLVLFGDTKAGKTTLLYYLSGQQLKRVENKKTLIKSLQPASIYHNAKISDMTSYPNIYSDQRDQWTIIDFPGFNDDRNLNKLLNIFIIQNTFKKFQSVHFCFVIPNQLLEGLQLVKSLEEFNKFVNNKFIQQSKAFSIILTKTEDDNDVVKQNFFELLGEIKEGSQYQQIKPFVQILESVQDHVFCFANEDPVQQKGTQIMNQILQNKQFQNFHNLSEIFSQTYVQAIVGQVNNQNFQSYEVNLVQQILQILKSQIFILSYVFKFVSRSAIEAIQGKESNLQLLKQQDINYNLELCFKNNKELLQRTKNIISNKNEILSKKDEDKVIEAISQLNKNFKNSLQKTDSNSQIQKLTLTFKKIKFFLKLFSTLTQLQSLTKKNNQTLKSLSMEFFEITNSIQSIIFQIKQINLQKKQFEQKLNYFKNVENQSLKQAYQNLINWKSFFKHVSKSQNQSSQIQRNDKSHQQSEIIQKTREQQIYQELQPLLKYKKIDYFMEVSKKSGPSQQQQKKQDQNNKQLNDQAKNILNVLKQYVRKYQSIQKKPAKEQKDLLNFYSHISKCDRVKNQEFLQFFLENLIVLLQIFNQYNKWNLFKSIISKKICPSLIKFNFFEEAILFAMIIPDIELIEKIMSKNCKLHKLKRQFIEKKLIEFSIKIKSKSILIKCFNELNCNYNEDRFSSIKQQNNYEKNLQLLKDHLEEINKQNLNKKQNNQPYNLNLQYIQDVSIMSIISKLKLIKERNQKCKPLFALKKMIAQNYNKSKNNEN